MSTPLFTENFRFSHVVKAELWPEAGYTRKVVTYNGTAGELKIGTVLGKVTANGKYKIAVRTAVDGSAVADAIVVQDLTAALNTDTNVLVLIKGPAIVSKAGLILDETYDTYNQKAAVYASLEAKGIQVNDAA